MDNDMTEGMMVGPDGVLLRFFYDTLRNEKASAVTGRAIFDTVLFVDLITPGQKSSTPRFEIERLWSEQSIQALGINTPYKRGYKYAELEDYVERFKRKEAMADMGGTPLKQWPQIDRGTAAMLATLNLYTVEQLANVSDSDLQHIGLGARELREQARSYLAVSEDGAQVSQLTDRAMQAETESKRLGDALALANARINELEREKDAAPKARKSADPLSA